MKHTQFSSQEACKNTIHINLAAEAGNSVNLPLRRPVETRQCVTSGDPAMRHQWRPGNASPSSAVAMFYLLGERNMRRQQCHAAVSTVNGVARVQTAARRRLIGSGAGGGGGGGSGGGRGGGPRARKLRRSGTALPQRDGGRRTEMRREDADLPRLSANVVCR